MNRKLLGSTLSKGWAMTSVCKIEFGNKDFEFSFSEGKASNLFRSLSLLLLAVFFCTPSYGQCTITCDDQKQISLGTNGFAIIIPELILNGDFSCAGTITVTVFDENDQPIGDTVRCEHIGKTFSVGVTSTAGLDCWSTIIIEDKLAPSISCSDKMIACSAPTLPDSLGYPIVSDNCDDVSSSDLRYFDLYTELPCGTIQDGRAVNARITRSWTLLDGSGNVGVCTQNIYLLKDSVQEVQFPQHRDNVNGPALNCFDDPHDLSLAGEPMMDGSPIKNGDACKFFVSYQDQTEDICPPSSYRIFRRWEVIDICTKEINVYVQNIFLADNTPPVLNCPDSFSVEANIANCGATVILPLATATDSCSNVTVQPSWEFGTGYGPFLNVPVGTHDITYTATDGCGNSISCTSKVTVVDNVQPIAVCRDELHVALNNEGFADVFAATFDGGSRDNCAIVKMKVSRDTLFGDSIRVSCQDLSKSIEVTLRVYDPSGLTNECRMKVIVNDEAPPTISCPPFARLNCSEDYKNTALTGKASATDNCGVMEIYFQDTGNINSCNTGTVTRTWFAVDSSGNFTSCTQLIYLEDITPIEVVFPEEYITTECGANLTPDSTGRPIITGDDCEDVLVSYTDETFLIADSACMKILRKWRVLEWCSFDPNDTLNGAYTIGTQTIKVLDQEAPVITACPPDITVGITEFACEAQVVLPDLVATDCNPNLTITNTSIYADSGGKNASGTYPIGVHKITFIISDGCGNLTTCETRITVEDQKPPTPVCKHGLSIALMQEGFVFVPPDAINASSYDNCSAASSLTYEISPNYFTCDDLGKQTINLIVTDQNGNSDFCTTEIYIQENNNACVAGTFSAIGGKIITEDGFGMEEVAVEITGGKEAMGFTDMEGNYLFENLSRLESYIIRPITDFDFSEGISTFDLVYMRQHILGVKPLESPYKMLAADVNKSGTISAYDMVMVRQVILGSRTDFPGNTSWRYIDATYEFPDPRNPFIEIVPEFHNCKRLFANDLKRDFIGIKVGDVNNSASPAALKGTSREKRETLFFEVADKELKSGFEYKIPFRAKEISQILGYQFTIDFDQNSLTLKEVIPGEPITMGQNNFGFNKVEAGKLTTSWENAGEIPINEETVLFALVFEANKTISLSEVMLINSRITLAEAYNAKEEVMDVALRFSNDKADRQLDLYQNYPNPFRGKTSIAFNLPKSTEGTISIHDITGRLLKTYVGKYAQGYNEVAIDLSDLTIKTGVLYYHLQTPITKRLSKKMVLIKE